MNDALIDVGVWAGTSLAGVAASLGVRNHVLRTAAGASRYMEPDPNVTAPIEIAHVTFGFRSTALTWLLNNPGTKWRCKVRAEFFDGNGQSIGTFLSRWTENAEPSDTVPQEHHDFALNDRSPIPIVARLANYSLPCPFTYHGPYDIRTSPLLLQPGSYEVEVTVTSELPDFRKRFGFYVDHSGCPSPLTLPTLA